MEGEDERRGGAPGQRQVGVDQPVVGVDDVGALLADQRPQAGSGYRVGQGRRVVGRRVGLDPGDPVHARVEVDGRGRRQAAAAGRRRAGAGWRRRPRGRARRARPRGRRRGAPRRPGRAGRSGRASAPSRADIVGRASASRTGSKLRRVRIAIVTPRDPRTQGGVERHVAEVARRHAAAGHEVTVLCGDAEGDTPRTERRDGYEVRVLPAHPRGRDWFWVPALWREMRRADPEIVHVQSYHTLVPPLAMTAGAPAARPLRAHLPRRRPQLRPAQPRPGRPTHRPATAPRPRREARRRRPLRDLRVRPRAPPRARALRPDPERHRPELRRRRARPVGPADRRQRRPARALQGPPSGDRSLPRDPPPPPRGPPADRRHRSLRRRSSAPWSSASASARASRSPASPPIAPTRWPSCFARSGSSP